MLKRTQIYLSQSQHDFLISHPDLTVSEHIRRAIDDYIKRLKDLNVSSSKSPVYGKESAAEGLASEEVAGD